MEKVITLKFLDGVKAEVKSDGSVEISFNTNDTKRDLWLNQIDIWSKTNDKLKECGYLRLENNDRLKLVKNR